MNATVQTLDGRIVSLERKTAATIGYGPTRGWLDVFASYGPLDLIGTSESPGAYYRMRYGHPIIKSILDRRKDIVASTPIRWAGPHEATLNAFWDRLAKTNPELKLSRLLAEIIDQKTSFGFSLYEKRWDSLGLNLWLVDPRSIYEFVQPDKFASEPAAIRFVSTAQSATFAFDNFYLFSNRTFATNWWGESILYCLLRDFLTWESEWKTYISARMLEKGVIHAKETGSGSTTTRDEIIGAIKAILRGQDVGIITDGQWDISVIQVSNGQDAVAQKNDLDNAFNECIRQTLSSNLNTLGLSSVGSKALAETMKINDEEAFESFLENEFEEFCASTIVEDLAYYLGIPQSEIAISTFGAEYKSSAIDPTLVWGLVEKGILSLQSLGPDNTAMMIESLGLDPSSTSYMAPKAEAIVEDTIPEADTYLPPSTVRKLAAVAIAKIFSLPKEQRGVVSGHELALIRKIASNGPLPMRTLAQWDALLDAELNSPAPNPLRVEAFGGMEAREYLDSELSPAETLFAESLSDLDLKPTEAMASNARKGLEWREEFNRGGTAVGVARARDIANRKNLSPETVSRMVSFFARHAQNEKAEGWESGEEGYPSAGRVAHELWGGDSGRTWAEAKFEQIKRIRSDK